MVDVNLTVVEAGEHPRFGGVKVDAFDAVRTGKEFALRLELGVYQYTMCLYAHLLRIT